MSPAEATPFIPTVGPLEHGMTWIGRSRIRGTFAAVAEALVAPYVAALEDPNPRWWTGGEVPPAMNMTFGAALSWRPDGSAAMPLAIFEIPLPGESLIGASVTSEIMHPIRVGDCITVTEVVLSISKEKKTALGAGHFVTWQWTYTNQDGTVCGSDTVVSVRFTPREAS